MACPMLWPAASAAPANDARNGAGTRAFTPDRSIDERYTELSTEPITAMPMAPPTSRVTSFTAEPTPALARGSEPMIDEVDGGMISAIPAASTMSPIMKIQ